MLQQTHIGERISLYGNNVGEHAFTNNPTRSAHPIKSAALTVPACRACRRHPKLHHRPEFAAILPMRIDAGIGSECDPDPAAKRAAMFFLAAE